MKPAQGSFFFLPSIFLFALKVGDNFALLVFKKMGKKNIFLVFLDKVICFRSFFFLVFQTVSKEQMKGE